MKCRDFSGHGISCERGPFGARGFGRSQGRLMSRWQAAVASALATALAPSAFAQQTEITISMDPPPAAPRINGSRVIGWRPGTPFLYAIPATGQSPLTFAATLPSGLSIDASSGTISGTTPAAGSYPIDVTVANGSGSATATLTLVVGDTLALTPPMGWNSYDSFYENVREQDVLAAAQAMKDVLQPYGWNTIVIDYLWYDPENAIDEYGRLLPSPSKYPNANGSNGFSPIADQVHALGMSFGIHLMRGIPRNAFAADTPIFNSGYTAQDAGNSNDACPWDDHMWGVRGDTAAGQAWYDSIYSQYADWGVDFVKVDDMMNPYGGNVVHEAEVVAVHSALQNTNRSIVYSLSPGPHPTSAVQVLAAHANMWRTVNDFWDTNGLSTMDDEFDAAHAWAETEGITPGHWPDADMLPLGIIGNRPCEFTHNQQVTVMTLWSIMPSPLMFGGQPTRLEGDDWTIALLTNEEVLAVNQDALGSRGRRISQQGSTEVWARDLSGGRKAVALFNRGSQDAAMSVTFSELGVSGTATVRDLWRKEDLTGATSEISVDVPYESALMYTVSNPDAGTGGTSGVGGATGTAGTAGTAGAAGGAGAPDGGSAGESVGGSGVGTGGTLVGSGGTLVGTGGTLVGTGGTLVGSGGTLVGTGGTVVGSGGTSVTGSGGTLVGSGGTPVTGSGGTPVTGSGGALVTGGTGVVDGSGGGPSVGGALGVGGADLGGGGEAPNDGDSAADESGCGCRTAGKRADSTPLVATVIFGLFMLGARRRRRAPGVTR